MKPYQPVPGHIEERLQIAILTGEVLALQWAETEGDRAFVAKVSPLSVEDLDGARWLHANTEDGEAVRIRLDLIRNLPTPVK
jgi:hypothetical protein